MISDGPWYDSASRNACAVCAIFAPNATFATYTCPYMFASRPRSFLPTGLPDAANLAAAPSGVDFDCLAAGVRVHLGVEDEDVDVAPVREHVIEPAVADVVRPAVAADEPHALLHQVVGERFEPAGFRSLHAGEPLRSATTRSR